MEEVERLLFLVGRLSAAVGGCHNTNDRILMLCPFPFNAVDVLLMIFFLVSWYHSTCVQRVVRVGQRPNRARRRHRQARHLPSDPTSRSRPTPVHQLMLRTTASMVQLVSPSRLANPSSTTASEYRSFTFFFFDLLFFFFTVYCTPVGQYLT